MKDKIAIIAILISLVSLVYAARAHHEATKARQELEAATDAASDAAYATLQKREAELVRKIYPKWESIIVDMVGPGADFEFKEKPKTFEDLIAPFVYLMDKLGQ